MRKEDEKKDDNQCRIGFVAAVKRPDDLARCAPYTRTDQTLYLHDSEPCSDDERAREQKRQIKRERTLHGYASQSNRGGG